MARPRLFKIDDVLRNAMEVFWRKGFSATSLSDIYAATGLKPGNLYGNFKDKDALFREAFETYAQLFRSSLPVGVEGLPAITAWLREQARLGREDPQRKGCLIVNTIVEREAHPPATQALAEARLAEIRAFFATHVGKAVEAGELGRETQREKLADALVGAVIAIMSLARAGASGSAIDHVADHAIDSLRERRG